MNKVQLIGRVGNPFVRHGQSATGEFTFATSGNEKDQYGNWKEVTEWHTIKVLGETNCQQAQKHFQPGKPLYIEGRLKTEHWTDNTGGKRSKTKIYMENWQFLPSEAKKKEAVTVQEVTEKATGSV